MTQASNEETVEVPFYIEAGCCLLCGVPEAIAPELFHTDEVTCSLIRQPATADEIDKAIEAMWSSELDCIRYSGSELAILKRLGEAGLSSLADDPRAKAFPRVIRDKVTFSLQASQMRDSSPRDLASAFRAHLQGGDRYRVRSSLLRPRTVRFAWHRRHFHSVTFARAKTGEPMASLVAAQPHALQGLARVLDGWLKSEVGALDISWHSRSSFRRELAGIPSPL